MVQLHRLDGFQVFAGLLGVVAGPIILATGALAPGWGVVITGAGAIVLWAQWKESKGGRSATSRPGPDTTDVLDRDVDDASGRRVVERRKLHVGS